MNSIRLLVLFFGTVALLGIGNARAESLPNPFLCVNSGGQGFTSSEGVVYLADTYYSGGNSSSHAHAIEGTQDDTLYQTERWGTFSYSLPVPQPGHYIATLQFAEIYYQATSSAGGQGSRVFDILLQGQQVTEDFDILAQVPSKTALDTSYVVEASSSAVDLTFGVSADYPKLSAICIRESDGDFDGDGVLDDSDAFPMEPTEWQDSDGDGVGDNSDSFPNDSSEWADLDGDGIGNNSDTDRDGDGYTNADDAFPNDPTEWLDSDGDGIGDNVDSTPYPVVPTFSMCINAGGPAYTAVDGTAFLADSNYSGGRTSTHAHDIADTNDDLIYRSERWRDFTYELPVPEAGNYTVDLHFAEIYYQATSTAGGPGTRVFDVYLEDELVLDNFDVLSETSSKAALVDTRIVQVADGALSVSFGTVSDWPKISAVCIRESTGDSDGDGVSDMDDAFPFDSSEWLDSDGDGFGDNADAFPNDATEWSDADGNGIGDNFDPDIDGDGHQNEDDAFPLDASEWTDMDGDGIGDNTDADRDGDGFNNESDLWPNDPNEWEDVNGNGIGDNSDPYLDSDGDGVPNVDDAFPSDPGESADLDNDGVGDNTDTDRDGDGYPNNEDAFPNDSSDWLDSDGDGIGDNADPTPFPPFSMCVNSGGSAYTGADGLEYMGDSFYTGGNSSARTFEIEDTDDDMLYRSERWGDYTYSLPVPEAGNYVATLHFAEIYYQAVTSAGGAGSRVFDIYIENELVADNFDILSQVATKTALQQSYFVNSADDTIAIGFGLETDMPKLSAVCIRESDGDFDDDGVFDEEDAFPADATEWQDTDGDGIGDNSDAFPNDATEWADLDGDGIGDNSDSDRDGDGYPNNDDAFPGDATEWLDSDGDGIGDNADPTPYPIIPTYSMCINAGGSGYSTQTGVEYLGDSYYTGGSNSSHNHEIADTIDDQLYTSERWGEFTYTLPVPVNGPYVVALMFAEVYFQASNPAGGPGSRVFNILVEGQVVNDSYDILAEVDSKTAVVHRYLAEVDDGDVSISFNAVKDQPKLSAVCVLESTGDFDGDGYPDTQDAFPNDPLEWVDGDGDGVGDNGDPFPTDPSEWADLDADGIGDNSDPDIDGDGYINAEDAFPYDTTEWTDLDGDGIGDNTDTDRDGDGVENQLDLWPNDPAEWEDVNNNGIGDNSDPELDSDADGVPNVEDAFPFDASEWLDSDGDGVGDNTDAHPTDSSKWQYSPAFDVVFIQGDAEVDTLAKAQNLVDNVEQFDHYSLEVDRLSFSSGGSNHQSLFGTALPFEYVDNFVMQATRTIYVPESAEYNFVVRSDDGSQLKVNGEVVITDDETHPPKNNQVVLYLSEGLHTVEILYFDYIGGATVEFMAAKGGQDAFYFSDITEFALVTDRVDAELTPPTVFEPHIGGQWGPVIEWPEIPVSAAQLPDGRLLTWAGAEPTSITGTKTVASLYDPESGTFVSKDSPGHNIFCSGISLMEDGSIFNSGGDFQLTKTSRFDLESLTWVKLDDMNFPRWYPTAMTMPDNRVFTTFAMGAGNTSEVYSGVTDQWVHTPGANMQSLVDEQNSINAGQKYISTWMQFYSFMNVAPNGQVFQSGPMETMHWFGTQGEGSVEEVGKRLEGDQARMFGSAVMYDVGKILITGGNDPSLFTPSSNTAIQIDLNSGAPVVSEVPSMNHARTFHDSVVLPTGKVMIIGGNTKAKLFNDEGTILQPEIWDPETLEWQPVNSHDIPRNYHSTGLLLKDGRVFSGGGGLCGDCTANHQDAQLYSPAYLFNEDGSLATRPVISQGPGQVNAGDTMLIEASESISAFNMIRLQGTTHSINTDQRFIPLSFGGSDGSYQVDINPNPNVMIPGYYWLFAIDDNGVPSEGFTVQVLRDDIGLDSDGDGYIDSEDAFPQDPQEWLDSDGDGIGNNSDSDRDGDGVANADDVFPDDEAEWLDSDGDGVGDNKDAYPFDGNYFVAQPSSVTNSTTLVAERDTQDDKVWVVNPDNNTVSYVLNGVLTAEIGVGNKPSSIALDETAGRVWVTNKADATLASINLSTLQVDQTYSLPINSQPHGLVLIPGETELLVVLEASGSLVRVDTSTGALLGSVDLGGTPRHLAVDASGVTAYVTNFITPSLVGESTASVSVANQGGEMDVVDLATMSIENTITLGYSARMVSESTGPGMPNYLNAPVLSADGTLAYVPSKQDNILAGQLRGGAGMNFDQTVRAVTSVVDLVQGEDMTSVRLDHDNAGVATGAVFSGDGRYLFVALETSREVAVYDTVNGYELTRLSVGRAPQGLAVSGDGERLHVHNFMDRSLTTLDLTDMLVSGGLEAPGSSVSLVDNERLASEVLLGKQLFYDAADDRLARDNYMSCASCHNDGRHDGRTWDLTGLGEGLRNTTDLTGKGTGHGRVHWTGNFDEVQDFESQIRALAGGTGLIDDSDFNAADDPLASSRAGLSADLDALASYLASLDTNPPSPYFNGTLSAEATAGEAVYQSENCASCHSGDQRTDSGSGVLHDIGTMSAVTGSTSGDPVLGIDTPTLDFLWATAPYLHDGSAASVADAILAHDVLNVSEQEAIELEAYLLESDAGRP